MPTNVLSRPNFVKQQIRTGRPDISNAPCPNPSHQNRNKVKSRIHTLLRTYLCHICQQFEMKNMYIVKVQGPPHAKWWWTIQQIWRLSSSVYVCSRVPKRLTCNQRANPKVPPTAHAPITAMTDTRLAPESSMRVPQVTEPVPCITLVFLQISPLGSLRKFAHWKNRLSGLRKVMIYMDLQTRQFTNNSFEALVVSRTGKSTTQPR